MPSVQSMQGALAIVGGTGADLYDAPDGELLRSLIAGDTLNAVARTGDSLWVQVVLDGEEAPSGWVARGRLVIFDVESLPILEGDATEGDATEGDTAEPITEATQTSANANDNGDENADDKADAAQATPTATPRPTRTPTRAPTSTPTATPEPTPAPTQRVAASAVRTEVVAVARSSSASILDAPNGEPVMMLPPGSRVSAVGRSEGNDFVYATTRGGDGGWIAVGDLVIFGYERLPLRDAEAGDGGGSVEAAADAEEMATGDEAEGDAETVTVETAGADQEAATVADSDATASPADAAGSPTADSPAAAGSAAATALPPIGPRELDAEAVDEAGSVTATVQITDSRLNVRSGPGSRFNVIAKALPRATFIVLGRSENSEWVQVRIEGLPDGFGWVAANLVRLSGSLNEIPTTDETTDAPTWNGPALNAPRSTGSPGGTLPTEASSTNERAADDAAAGDTEQGANEVAASPQSSAQPSGLTGKLAIRAADGGIYVYNLATGALDRITSGIDPEINRDGTRVAFVREGGDNGVYIVDLGTGEEETVYTGGEVLRSPKFSPDGAKVAFSRVFDTSVCFDTPVGCLPTTPPGVPEQAPNYDEIVDDYQEALSDFERANIPLRVLSRVTLADNDYRDLPALYRARAEDWNEGGIVYSSNGIEITADEPDATTEWVLRESRWRDPDWQPGNGAIAVHNVDGSNHSEIYLVNPDGGGLRAITRPVTTLVDQLPSNVAPAWSPDGEHIVYLSNRDDENDAGAWRVWVMEADGGNQRPLPLDLDIEYKFDDAQVVSWGR